MTTSVHIAWIAYQRRQASMARYFGFRPVFLDVSRGGNLFKKACQYIWAALRTIAVLMQTRPTVIWVQLPQIPLLFVALFYKALRGGKVMVVADCHNAVFREPWRIFPFAVRALRASNLVVVHNDSVRAEALAMLGDFGRVVVVEDPPAAFGNLKPAAAVPAMVMFPASFAPDEPIDEIIETAKLLPGVRFLVTGNFRKRFPQGLPDSLPKNITFTGYLSLTRFEELLGEASCILALTTLEGVQLSVCGEAIGAGRPMIASNTKTLQSLYATGTVFVSHVPSDMAAGISEVLENFSFYSRQIEDLRHEIVGRYESLRVAPYLLEVSAFIGRPGVGHHD